MSKPGGRYEEQAEPVTVTGWTCKTCHRFYGNDEHLARWCCASDLPCECGGRITDGPYARCKACRNRKAGEAWAKMERVEWDGKTPLRVYDGDKYLFDDDDLQYYIEDRIEDGAKIEDIRLVLCEPGSPRYFDMSDFLSDDLPEDFDDHHQFAEINKTVNDFIKAGSPWAWYAGNKALSTEWLREFAKNIEKDAS